jgi:hypothetical protein
LRHQGTGNMGDRYRQKSGLTSRRAAVSCSNPWTTTAPPGSWDAERVAEPGGCRRPGRDDSEDADAWAS